MSDKLFFKGRQAPRLDHSAQSFTSKASLKRGSKKYPLEITVGSESRKAEVAALVAEHELIANIAVSEDSDFEEDISELMALVNRTASLTVEKTPSRNEPCSCGSGKKYKKCCG